MVEHTWCWNVGVHESCNYEYNSREKSKRAFCSQPWHSLPYPNSDKPAKLHVTAQRGNNYDIKSIHLQAMPRLENSCRSPATLHSPVSGIMKHRIRRVWHFAHIPGPGYPTFAQQEGSIPRSSLRVATLRYIRPNEAIGSAR